MKKLSKFASLLLALVMVLALTVPAMAVDETYTVTIPESLASHTLVAYQIFSGTQAKADDKTLGNIAWGEGFKGDAFLSALIADETLGTRFTDCTDAAGVAAKMKDMADNSAEAIAFAKLAKEYVGSGTTLVNGENKLSIGYYLIVDETETLEEGDAANALLLQVNQDIEIKPKTGAPTPGKQVKDVNDSNDITGWGDSADYDIGDDVPFELSAQLPGTEDFRLAFDQYETYQLVFHDTLSAGLVFDSDSVVVKVDNKELNLGADYTIETSGLGDDCTFHVVLADIKTTSTAAKFNSKITVEYKAKLTGENVKIGNPGNPNDLFLEYSNNPAGEGTGQSAKITVVVLTFKMEVEKVDENEEPLAGAGFNLYKYDPDNGEDVDGWVDLGAMDVGGDGTTFSFKGLDDGRYMIRETTTPPGYNTIEDQYFMVEATHNNEDAEKKIQTLTVTWTDAEGTPKTGDDGLNLTMESQPDAGSFNTQIQNEKGTTLPETGGIGTTIFYIVGGLLVAGAAVLLITKKRMSNEE